MVTDNHDCEKSQDLRRAKARATLIGAESMHSGRKRSSPGLHSGTKDKVPFFWQLLGGTIVSIAALILITAYNQITSTETDLRRDLTQIQAELIRKEELNARLTVMWNSIKELHATRVAFAGLDERAKTLSQNLDAQNKSDEELRKHLQGQIGELNARLQALAERVAAIESSRPR